MGFSHFRIFTFTTCINMQISTTNKHFHFPGISTMLPSHIHIACCCNIFFKYTYYLKNKRLTSCHLLFYFTSYVLNMFRILIHPSSGACDCIVELTHWSFFFSVKRMHQISKSQRTEVCTISNSHNKVH